MISNKLVSIIIPIYNTGALLEKCLYSVIKQDYNNIEIILVNDGSDDNSLNICENFKNKDSRIHIINQRNLGVSAARNRGFYYSSGDYICYVDSDDAIETDMISTLVRLIENYECEVAGCNIHIINKDKTEKVFYSFEKPQIFNNDQLKKLFLLGRISHACWDKIYKREVLERVNFPVGTTGEDRYFCWQLYKFIRKIVITQKIGYHYIRRTNNSITSRPLSFRNISRIEEALNVRNDIILHFPELYNEWEFYYLSGLENLLSKFLSQGIQKDNELYRYCQFVLSELSNILKSENPLIDVERRQKILKKINHDNN